MFMFIIETFNLLKIKLITCDLNFTFHHFSIKKLTKATFSMTSSLGKWHNFGGEKPHT